MLTILHDILPIFHDMDPALAEVSFTGYTLIKGHLKKQVLSLGFAMPELLKCIQQCDFLDGQLLRSKRELAIIQHCKDRERCAAITGN